MAAATPAHFIGLMSGTSTDGVDAVLADFTDATHPRVLASAALPMPPALRSEFLALNSAGPDELRRAALAGNALAELYAQACLQLLSQTDMAPREVRAIGAHGQTVRHDPASGYTIQINAPALLAELTGIAVIADFRSRDIAAGGQGAPLVPAFHQAIFSTSTPRAVLNLGGIANVTLLPPSGSQTPVRGFDTGPANVLLDAWTHEKTGQAYDADGGWGATGTANPALLDYLLASEPWFALPPPKSTGRDLFNLGWLTRRLDRFGAADQGLSDADIQATLVLLTAHSAAQAILTGAPDISEVLVCGGGACNPCLIQALEAALHLPVIPTSDAGIPVQEVEALAFAWLAWAHEAGICAGLPTVTGAAHPSMLGCRYPGTA